MAVDSYMITKIVEMIIILISLIIWEAVLVESYLSANTDLTYVALGGFAIICGILLVGIFIGSEIDKRLNGAFSLIGCILFIVAGALMIVDWEDSSSFGTDKEKRICGITVGALMILNGIVFLVELILFFVK